jgi:hypothetical protein
MLVHDVPDYCIGNPVVFVPQYVAHPHDLRPRNLRLRRLKLWGNAPLRCRRSLRAWPEALGAVTAPSKNAFRCSFDALSQALIQAIPRGQVDRDTEPMLQKLLDPD